MICFCTAGGRLAHGLVFWVGFGCFVSCNQPCAGGGTNERGTLYTRGVGIFFCSLASLINRTMLLFLGFTAEHVVCTVS